MKAVDEKSNRRWAKSPMHQMRSSALRDASRNWKVGTFLELGAGTGSLSQEFIERGFAAILYDIGAETCELLRERFAGEGERVRVIDNLACTPGQSVDYLFAFEVLEHVAEDAQALKEWTRKLKPGGFLLISVPAHSRKYGPSDRRVGHVRRYERAQLRNLLAAQGYVDTQVICYGFPLGNITRKVGNLLQRNAVDDTSMDPVARSIDSGMHQSSAVLRLASMGVLNHWTLSPFWWVQRLFFGTELGDGYVAWGRLKGHADSVADPDR